MAKKNPVYERLDDQSETLERVEPRQIAEALEAEDVGPSGAHGSPFSVWVLHSKLVGELVSTGGRPGRRDASSRKISMTDSEWGVLEQVTALLKRQGVNAAPSQVAGLLLSQSLTEVLRRLERVAPSTTRDEVNGLSDSKLEATLENVLTAAASAEVHLEQLRPVALELLRQMRDTKGADGGDDK